MNFKQKIKKLLKLIYQPIIEIDILKLIGNKELYLDLAP